VLALLWASTSSMLALACASDDDSAQMCARDRDCADGFVCGNQGACVPVVSFVGQPCTREADCGPGQTCAPTPVDADQDGSYERLAATCQLDREGGDGDGGACRTDDDCAAGGCALGRCSLLCVEGDDCRAGLDCVAVPRDINPESGDSRQGLFATCVPAIGLLRVELPVGRDGDVAVPVPAHARSFTLVVEGPEPDALVGVSWIDAPDGDRLYERPDPPEEYWTQPLRYAPATGVSSLMVPTSTAAPLELGVYHAQVRTLALGSATPPRASVVYRLGLDGKALDVNVHFVDLDGHPCPGADLDAARAGDPEGAFEREMLKAWRGALAPAGIAIGDIDLDDITGHPELAVIDGTADVRDLFSLSQPGTPALDVFVVRSILPLGVQMIVGGTPGPIAAGTPHSGIAISADALCSQGWAGVGRLAARGTARYLGLHESVDVDGFGDPLESTDASSDNLLYFGKGGTALTDEQGDIMRRSPLLR
jgi:hypothetical protein